MSSWKCCGSMPSICRRLASSLWLQITIDAFGCVVYKFVIIFWSVVLSHVLCSACLLSSEASSNAFVKLSLELFLLAIDKMCSFFLLEDVSLVSGKRLLCEQVPASYRGIRKEHVVSAPVVWISTANGEKEGPALLPQASLINCGRGLVLQKSGPTASRKTNFPFA